MKFSKNVAKASVAIILVLLFASVTLTTVQITPVEGQLSSFQQSLTVPTGEVPYVTTDTKAVISFRPNPIGLGQALLINVWINPALNTNRGFLSGQTGCHKVTLTKPDETQEVLTMRSTFSDTASYVEYTVDQAGEWKIKFEFLGTYFPAGRYYNGYLVENSSGSYIESAYYKPSSTDEYTFTVQNEMVLSWPPSPLPTDYWTRPVHYAHREWWPILGNWPTTGYQGDYFGVLWDQYYPDTNPKWSSNYLFHPWVQGPASAHVVWKREIGGSVQGGIIGAYGTQEGQMVDPGVPSIVYGGRCYQTIQKAVGTTSVYFLQCYDLRTGEIYWENEAPSTQTVVSMFGMTFISTVVVAPQYVSYITPSVSTRYSEVLAGGTHNVELVGITGDRLYKWHPYTGAITGNYSIEPLSGGTYYNQLDGYVLSIQNIGNMTNPNYRLINWTTAGSSSTLSGRIMSNTSYARSSLPSYIDWNEGIGVVTNMPTPDGIGAWYGLSVDVFDLYTGELLRTITSNHPDTSYSPLATCVDHGKVAVITQGGAVKAWDLRTGQVAWTFEMDYPWGSTGFGVYGVASAYGLFFRPSYDGLYAIDWETGELAWKSSRYTRAAFESPYTDVIGGSEVNPGMTNVRIADGKVYIYDGEHSPDQPRDRGWSLWCFNATTGEYLWDIAIFGSTAFGQEPSTGPIVDGYMLFPSTLGIQYVFGKGKSATTVSAPLTAITQGESVILTGTVLDLSPAQPGTPCVSQGSMRTQMEYLHFQFPIGGIWNNETITGVSVSLDVCDPNGNYQHIDDVVTEGYSGTFGYTWTPDLVGQYTVTATFCGDDSYGSSSATTYVSVVEAPAATPTPEPPQAPPDSIPYIIGIGIAILIAIAVVALLILRKR